MQETNLIQNELDIAEEYILKTIFGNVQNPQINQGINALLKLYGIDYKAKINQGIEVFEAFAKPMMKENGFVDGEKFTKVFGTFVPAIEKSGLNISDFRLIDAIRKVENILISIGQFIR